MNQKRDFAFGDSIVDDCQCPALTAGRTMDHDSVIEPAEWYDNILGEYHARRGVVDEETAKTAWLQMIEDLEEYYVDYHGYSAFEATEAREIAEDLGWM